MPAPNRRSGLVGGRTAFVGCWSTPHIEPAVSVDLRVWHIRQNASERLVAAGEGDLLADRHRAYFRELAERATRSCGP